MNKVDRRSETEEDSDEERKELERKLEKLKKKELKSNRLRREGPFDNESDYIDLQRQFNNSRYSSRDRTIRQVRKESKEDEWDLEEGELEKLFEVVVRQVETNEDNYQTRSPLLRVIDRQRQLRSRDRTIR